ncbi:putative phosphatase regulatory subunit-domain-containing protein [Fomes fomentarius]|nr:putative phosphatase regulatory subunit-domain-containing protein [Fomes fomentarius]
MHTAVLKPYTIHMDYSYSRHSNSAGAPLPRIPRRSSSTRSASTSASAPSSPPATVTRVLSADVTSPVPTLLVVQPPTPPPVEPAAAAPGSTSDDVSSSSSSSESYVQMNPRTKRTRSLKMQPFRSPAESTPTPAVYKAKNTHHVENAVAFPERQFSGEDMSGSETPRASSSQSTPRPNLHIDLDTLKRPLALQPSSSTNIRIEGSSGRAASAPHAGAANIARKKSGEPLKSSLKSRRAVVRGDLSVVTGTSMSSTKSEPSTPMASKSVHFDKRLEHVKLFLAEQKPLAISREGSPTDTSGTESDFPSAIYGPKNDKTLTMQVTNMPAKPRVEADLALEEAKLSEDGTSLNGRVRVRNLAFEKWVAVRFTVDSWQTTSEVTAKYHDSVPGGVFDRFSFTIRLNDMLARIEEKTLFFAIRYNVAGREIWDNNEGQNYKVVFAMVPKPRPACIPASSSEATGFASLKSKLENVVKGQETVGGYMARRPVPFTLEASTSLSKRYDFASSWKSPWTRSPTSPPPKSGHARNVTHPHAAALTFTQSTRRAGKQTVSLDDCGSPRMRGLHDSSPLDRPSSYPNHNNVNDNNNTEHDNEEDGLEDTPVPAMSRRRGRNHQRGYFDLGGLAQTSAAVRRTPTSSPKVSPERTPDKRGVGAGMGMWFLERGGSEESTPSVTSNDSSSPSPSPSEDGRVFGFGFGSESARSGSGSPSGGGGSDSYSVFLNRYCYYTGASDSFLLDTPPQPQSDAIHRSHSASSVEEFLSTSPSLGYLLSPGQTPTRSSSFDNVVSIGSGATTPTARSMGMGFANLGSPQLLSAVH